MNGFLNLHKPSGWTSHDCVAKVRRLLKIKKVGHGGTLDPAAVGVLPLAVGRATRLLSYLPGDKAYRATIQFGRKTSTDDLEGSVLQEAAADRLQLTQIEAVIPQFIGAIQQVPPIYSAVQVQGKRLYDLARQGATAETTEIPVRTVTVHSLDVVSWQPGTYPELTLQIACGAGTYIRSIARDLGDQVGTGATLARLVRTQSSGFRLDQSLTLEAIEAQLAEGVLSLIAPGEALQTLPSLTLAADASRRWCLGQKIVTVTTLPIQQPLRILDSTGRFLGIGELNRVEQQLVLSPRRVFATAS
ncbi:MAG: tRNA pseudouridine(55) synthase TruB [Leptolyngbya sp. SIO4C1]|nr:tRNA pseudouridine(55) synthase TruB [Leptolyngbya sp. SIO4C1]